MLKIVADERMPFLKGALEPFAEMKYMDGREITQKSLRQADALLIRTRTVCDESLLHGTPVKFIGSATIGFDHIDAGYCRSREIRWVTAPGCNADSVQQYVASVLATLAMRGDFLYRDKTIGIVGVGHVGKKVERLARLLGMKVLLNDPPRARVEGGSSFVTLERLLDGSDIVSLHVPLEKTGECPTFHLFNGNTLALLKKNAWLINTSRGKVVEEGSLLRALMLGRLAGAALDVWENEPEIDPHLLRRVSVATPHIAGYTTEGKVNGTLQVVRSLGAWFNLPLTDWAPSGIPSAASPVIRLDCRDRSVENIVCQAVLHAYDVMEDDLRLRSKPEIFEELRNNYPARREFPAYTILLSNADVRSIEILTELGFRVAGVK